MHKMKIMDLGLASLLVGSGRGITMRLANEKGGAADDKDKEVTTSRSAEHWKRKTALAINADPKMSDEDLEKAHDAHMSALTAALANDEEDGAIDPDAKLDNERGKGGVVWGPAASSAEAKEVKLANERVKKTQEKAAGLLIGAALSEGRILPAAKQEWEGKFANDFDAAETALKAETKKLNTQARSKDLGRENDIAIANESERRDKVQSLVNEEMGKNGGNYDLAFSTVRKSHKALFGAMKSPATKK